MPVPGGRFRGPPLSAGAAARVPPPRRARRGGGERGPECFRGSAPPSSILAAPSPAACRPAPRPGPAPLRRRAPRSRVPPPNFQKLRRHFLTYLAQRRRRRRGGPGAAPRSSVPGSAAARAPGPARRRAGGGVWARRGAGRLFNLAAAPGIVWGVRGSAARERMEGAGATWRPPGAARSPGRGATSAGRPRRAAPRGVNKALRMRAPLLPPSPPVRPGAEPRRCGAALRRAPGGAGPREEVQLPASFTGRDRVTEGRRRKASGRAGAAPGPGCAPQSSCQAAPAAPRSALHTQAARRASARRLQRAPLISQLSSFCVVFFFFFPALCNAERAACAGRLRASSWFRPQPGSAASCRWAPKTSSLHVKTGDFFFFYYSSLGTHI